MKEWSSNKMGVVALSVILFCGCSVRRSEPLVGPLPITSPELAQGQQVFMAKCHQCHPGGEAGVGPGLNDKPLPGFMIRFQVRNGFGAMPAFDLDELDDPALDHLLVYLLALRKHGS